MGWAPVLGAVIGGIFGKKKAKRDRQRALDDAKWQFKRLRQSAELGGFNPLTALENTGTAGFNNLPSGSAPLASAAIITNAIQGASDAITGEDAKQRARDSVQDQLAQIALDQAKSGFKNYVPQVPVSMPTKTTMAGTKIGSTPANNVGMTKPPLGVDFTPPALTLPDEGIPAEFVSQQVEISPDGRVAKAEPGWIDVIDKDGYVTSIPHVEVETEGLGVGMFLAAKKRISQSTSFQAIADSSVGSALSNIPKALQIVLNPETVVIPPLTLEKQRKPANHPFMADGLEIFEKD